MKKFASILLVLMLVSCGKDDDTLLPTANPTVEVEVQHFMWQAMNLWYYWQGDVADLADDRFATISDYSAFLATESDPEVFFFDKLTFSEDRFSFLNSDYKELTQNLAGIYRSNGLEFGLTYTDLNSNNQVDATDPVYGVVRYIIPNSNAASADILRGEIFMGVDGQDLNGGNYATLLFGDNATYTLKMANLSGGTLVANGKTVILTKEEGLQENPIYIVKTLDVGGQKVGYLMYNGFTNEYDEQLNQAFGTFVNEGVTDLVLDLRYNGGGSVNSSRLLSSMIFGRRTNDLYIRQRWNDKIQEAFTRDDPTALNDYFADKTGAGTLINTLQLSRVFVITTRSTASASELVINGLNPYIEVVKIGTTTTGKNEFSLTMVDDPERPGAPYIYTASRESSINPNNRWAIQPLVGRNENSAGFSDYTGGFLPDIELREDLQNMGVLGEPSEPLLAAALQEITGVTAKTHAKPGIPFESFTHSGMYRPLRNTMILDKPIQLPQVPKSERIE